MLRESEAVRRENGSLKFDPEVVVSTHSPQSCGRYVTGQSQGEFLAQLLNGAVTKRNRRAWQLQQDLRKLFTGVASLTAKLAATSDTEWSVGVQRLTNDVNTLLGTCAEYPQVIAVRMRGAAPHLVQVFAPTNSDSWRHNAISAICALVRYGLLDRVRQCQRTADYHGEVCGRWFFAKKSDSLYCSRDCQKRPTEEDRQRKREYAKRHYWKEKERAEQAKIRVRGGRK